MQTDLGEILPVKYEHTCASNLSVSIWKILNTDDGAERSGGPARATGLMKIPACPCISEGTAVLLHFPEMWGGRREV